MVSKVSTLYHRCSVYRRPGGRRGNTEQVVTQWRCIVAFMKALDLLHRAMLAILHRRTSMAIKMARDGGAFKTVQVKNGAELFWREKTFFRTYATIFFLSFVRA